MQWGELAATCSVLMLDHMIPETLGAIGARGFTQALGHRLNSGKDEKGPGMQ